MKSHEEVKQWLAELSKVILHAQRGISQFEAFIRVGEQLQNAIGKFMEIFYKNVSAWSTSHNGDAGLTRNPLPVYSLAEDMDQSMDIQDIM